MHKEPRGILENFWCATLWLFPITTPPFLILGNIVAKPLSILPAMMVVLIVLFTGGQRFKYFISREAKILYLFFIISIVGYIGSILVGAPEVDVIAIGYFFRGLIPLFVGIVFYLCFRMMNTNQKELKKSELIILTAMSVSVAIEIIQFLIMNWFPELSFIVDAIDSVLVEVSPGAWIDRFHGLAYEPSWLASQLTLIMLPLTLSRIIAKETLGEMHFGLIRVRLEWVFFVVCLLGIVLAGSRAAVFSAIAMFFVAAFSGENSVKKTMRNMLVFGITLLIIIGASFNNAYVGDTFTAIVNNIDNLDQLISAVSAAPRFSAWIAAWKTFLQHPIWGVGLGNSTFFYAANVPDWALDYLEVQGWLSGSGIVNPKNLLLKLAAETGLVGFVVFAIFVLRHFRGKNCGTRYKVLRNTGLVALIFNYFSLDSFALPTEWYLLGFIFVLGNETLRPKPALAIKGV